MNHRPPRSAASSENAVYPLVRVTLLWAGALTVAVASYQWIYSPPGMRLRTVVGALQQVPGNLGLLIPYASLAGGIALSRIDGFRWNVVVTAIVMAVSVYLLSSVVSPVIDYREDVVAGYAEQGSPYGAWTPSGLIRHREAVRALPRDSLTIRDQRRLPPNWLTFHLYSGIASALFVLPGILLGWLIGRLTEGMAVASRRNARWAIAVACGAAYARTEVYTAEWVRGSIDRSALLAVMLPLLTAAAMAGLLGLVYARRSRLHGLGKKGVP
jgi:hypothetical protein